MKNAWWFGMLCLGLAALLFAPLARAESDEEDEGQEEEIALDKVPGAVMKAAKDAVKGIVFSKAEKETKDGKTHYELEGKAGEKSYEIEVSPEGKVLKVEEEAKEEQDDDKKEEKGNKKSGKEEGKEEKK